MIHRGILRIPPTVSEIAYRPLVASLKIAVRSASQLSPNLSRSPEAKRARLDTMSSAAETGAHNGSFQHGDFGDYKLLSSFEIKYAPVSVGKWRSTKTGLSVVVGSYEGESRFRIS
jgi:hypothetical protein